MLSSNVVMLPCEHLRMDIKGIVTEAYSTCCGGSGYVMVMSGLDGQARPCKHLRMDIDSYKTCCGGAGWAGVVRQVK